MCGKKSVNGPDEKNQLFGSHIFVPVKTRVNPAFGGYYIALPPAYYLGDTTFPLLVFLHGLGQTGNGDTDLHNITFDGIGKLLEEKRFPLSFTSNGQQHSFIVVSPQSSRPPDADEVAQLVTFICDRYRIDEKRIYLSGLSMGARVVTLAAAKFPMRFAAIVPIAGVANNQGMEERCRAIAAAGLPVWELHNSDDPMADVSDARRFIQYIRSFEPSIPPRFTVFDVYGHDAWTTALDPAYREDGMNIYEWMLQYQR